MSAVLAACGGSGAQPSPEPGDPSMAGSSTSQDSSTVEIANPKDVTAIDVCDLLPDSAASSLGMKPEGERKSNGLKESLPDACVWEDPDDGGSKISLTAIDGRSIQVYYDNRSTYQDFEKINVEGYPAVRANKISSENLGSCNIFLGVNQKQVVMTRVRLNNEETGAVNPCDRAKRALELSVSSWPDAE
ncbi:DUF3558 domain-containing protein [Actinopolyspora mortivallis]|uniref:DUF3558 domain-containing protein n=1 Tax=Actinopolyspora mortivallis TaxID=33906 RepID=UPI001C63A525|nr:DUF3558 domain-containing protein [Actinopolyspora mortivallis]